MPVAFLDLPDIQGLIFFVVRVVLGVVAGLATYFLAGPLVRLLYRLAFHRPPPAVPVRVGRVGLGILVGVLVFLYFPIGGGLGWGWGPGSGGGPGAGPGPGGTALGGSGEKGKTGKITPTGREKEETPAKDALAVELVPSKLYQAGSYRYYLIGGKGPPRTLAEVEEVLRQGKSRWRQMRILIPPDSAYASGSTNREIPDHPAVAALKDLANRYGLPHVEPKLYDKKGRALPDRGG